MGVTPAFEKCQRLARLYFFIIIYLLRVTSGHQLLCTQHCVQMHAWWPEECWPRRDADNFSDSCGVQRGGEKAVGLESLWAGLFQGDREDGVLALDLWQPTASWKTKFSGILERCTWQDRSVLFWLLEWWNRESTHVKLLGCSELQTL